MRSRTYGELSTEEMVEKIYQYYMENKIYECPFEIVIGTDSQNFSDTKIVKVVCILCVGHGGIYFYDVSRVNKINDVRVKLNKETALSLDLANEVIQIMEGNSKYEELYLNAHFAIHVDAGKSSSGKTKDLIPSIVGWVHACGYDCVVKPDSFAASSVADRLSK